MKLHTRRHHLVAPGSVSNRVGYSSPLFGGRTRALIFGYGSQASWPSWWKAGDFGQDDVFMLYRMKPLSGWSNRVVDGHTEVADKGLQDDGDADVSSFAIDHNDTLRNKAGAKVGGWGLRLQDEPAGDNTDGYWTIRLGQGLGVAVAFYVHLKMARKTGGGFVRIWDLTGKTVFDPWSTPTVDTGAANTIWPGQDVMHFFGPGPYNKGASATIEIMAPQFGKTGWAQAFAEVPAMTDENVPEQGPNDYSEEIASWDTASFAQLAGTPTPPTTPPPPPPPADPCATVKANLKATEEALASATDTIEDARALCRKQITGWRSEKPPRSWAWVNKQPTSEAFKRLGGS